MTNFEQRFSNYKTLQGLTLQLEEGEHIVIDGFDCTCSGLPSLYGFLTNKRFILRQTNFNYGSRYANWLSSDCLIINLDEVEYISLHRGIAYFPRAFTMRVKGTMTDYSKEQKKNEDLFVFQIRPGGFGHNTTTLYERLTTQLPVLGKEFDFETLFFGRNANLGEMGGQRKMEIQNGQRIRQIIGVPAAALLYSVAGLFLTAKFVRLSNAPGLAGAQTAVVEERVDDAVEENLELLDPATSYTPIRDATGRFDYVMPNQEPPKVIATQNFTNTCYTTAFPGSNGTQSKEYGCNIQYNPHSIDVKWSDGINTTFNFEAYGFTIDTNGTVDAATMEIVSHQGKKYYLFESFKGASTWIPLR